AGRHSPRDRVGGGTAAGHADGADRAAVGPAVPLADRRLADRSASPADPPFADRLELRPAEPNGEVAPRPAVGIRRRGGPRGRRAGLRGGSARGGGGGGTPGLPPGPE